MTSSWWLFLRFSQREVSNRFAGSLLGGLWALVHPLVLLLIYSFVFTSVMRLRPVAETGVPFVVFLAVALWPWLAFQEAVMRGTGSVVANGALVKKVPFAHEVVVHAAVASSFAVQLGGYFAVLAFMVLTGQPLYLAGIGLMLLSLLGLAALATGLALMLGAMQVFVRDVEQGLAPTMGMLFYLCPILYPASMVPEWMRQWMMLNPVAVLIEACRAALLDGRIGPGPAEGWALLVCAAVLVLGRLVFHRLSPHFEEAL
ncbi:MAG: ABC transporter permease [Burkholderiales bacterium]|nr:ABC transporter permease [Burkholderiales bacterium]